MYTSFHVKVVLARLIRIIKTMAQQVAEANLNNTNVYSQLFHNISHATFGFIMFSFIYGPFLFHVDIRLPRKVLKVRKVNNKFLTRYLIYQQILNFSRVFMKVLSIYTRIDKIYAQIT